MIVSACCIGLFCSVATAQAPLEKPRPRVALVLEGGGALGLAHIGVIKVIEEIGIPVDIVVGTSMGAIVGGFYAQGYDAASLEEITLGIDWIGIFSEGMIPSEERYRDRLDRSRYFASIDFDSRGFKIPSSLLSGRKLLYFLDVSTISEPTPVDFDTLPRQYRAVAADLATGERVVIDKGSFADAMRASMGIPGIFSTHLIDGRYLVDGGAIDNLPVGTAIDLGADLVIAVDLLGGNPFAPEEFDRNPLDALKRTMEMMIRANVKEQLPHADLVITVDLTGYQWTDFLKSDEIMRQGEKAARDARTGLMDFKTRLGTLQPIKEAFQVRPQPPIQQLIIKGGDAKGRAKAYKLFSPIIGMIPDKEILDTSIASLESLGIYEFIRIQTSDEAGVPALVVMLTEREPPSESIRLGLTYDTTYSRSTSSNFSLSPSIIIRGITSNDSSLAVDFRVLDSPALEVSFIQPLGAYLFIEGFFDARRETQTYSNDLASTYRHQSQAIDVGIRAGTNLTKWSEAAIGFSYEWVQSDPVPNTRSGVAAESRPMAHALFSMHRFDSTILPIEGVYASLQYHQSLYKTQAVGIFQTLMLEGLYMPALNSPVSLALGGGIGSDFSKVADSYNAAPFYYKPDLANRHFSPGPLEVHERIGSHIASIGGEIKFKMDWAFNIIGLPSFLLVQAAAGTVLQDISQIQNVSEFIHLNTALGVGARLNDAFGISLRIGLIRGFGGGLRSFFALDLGSIGF